MSYDGDKEVRISAPGSMRGKMHGLCGNCNGDKADDTLIGDKPLESFASRQQGLQALARSFVVQDTSGHPSDDPA